MTDTIEDLMASAVGQRPMDFENAFAHLMLQKAGQAVEARKIEIAKSMFSDAVKEEVEEVDEGFGMNRRGAAEPELRKPSKPASTPVSTGKDIDFSSMRKAGTPITKTGSGK